MSVSFESLCAKWETVPLTFSDLSYRQLNQKHQNQFFIYNRLEKWLNEINVVISDLSHYNLDELKGRITSVNRRSSIFLQSEISNETDLLRFGVMLAAFTLSKDQNSTRNSISTEEISLVSSAQQLAESMIWFETGLNEKSPLDDIVSRVVELEQSYLNFAEKVTLI